VANCRRRWKDRVSRLSRVCHAETCWSWKDFKKIEGVHAMSVKDLEGISIGDVGSCADRFLARTW
jgi:hypothetical protein